MYIWDKAKSQANKKKHGISFEEARQDMKNKSRPKQKGFDEQFDAGKVVVDFSSGISTEGLSKTIKFPPMEVPSWLAIEIERLAQFQANSRASVVRQLLVEAIEVRQLRLKSASGLAS